MLERAKQQLGKVHKFYMDKFKFYNTWHNQPNSSKIHKITLALFALFALISALYVMPFSPFRTNAASDTTVTVSATEIGTFTPDMLGGNLSPWGASWPSTEYNSLITDLGIGALRHGHATKIMVDMELWAAGPSGTNTTGLPPYNYTATGELARQGWSNNFGTRGFDFQNQADWLAARNLPVMYTLSDELSYHMRTGTTELDWNKVATAWVDLIGYFRSRGVNIKWIEIGNEVEIWNNQGIQYPPVEFSTGHGTANPNGIDPKNPEDYTVGAGNANDYIKLWEAVVPALRSAYPDIKIGPYASGMGPIQTPYYPYDYLFKNSPNKPDFYAYHHYPGPGSSVSNRQTVLDWTWQFQGSFVDWDDQYKSMRSILNSWGAPATTPIYLTEYNYDSATYYTPNDQMWDGIFIASTILNSANGGISGAYIWDTFDGSNTGGAITGEPSPRLKSQGLALRLLKQFKNNKILSSTVTSSDNSSGGPVSPNDGRTVAGGPFKRVESLATKDANGNYKTLLINKNISTPHVVNLITTGLTNNSATIKVYATRDSLVNQTPTTTNTTLSSGSVEITLPPLSMAVVDITASGGGGGDNTPPVISGVSSSSVNSSGATITWTTNEPSDSQVEYGTTTNYGSQTILNTNMVTSHSVTLSGLSPSTAYHFRVKSKDSSGNLAIGLNNTFTTLPSASTLTVSLTTNINLSKAPARGISLKADVGGTATGNINYTFYCNRADAGTNITSPNSHKIDGTTKDPYNTPYDSCNSTYATAGIYTAKVIAERSGLSAEARVTITITADGINSGPRVSFTFDDGNKTVYTYFYPILKAAGFTATVYLNTDDQEAGYSDKLNVAELNQLKNDGWEISSHKANHEYLPANPTQADYDKYESEVARAKSWLDANGFTESGFASPGGASDPTIVNILKKYHAYNRTSWGNNRMPIADPYNLAVGDFSIQNLNQIQSDGSWAIFLDHGWVSGASDPTVVAFQQLVSTIKSRGIPVNTVKDTLNIGLYNAPVSYTITTSVAPAGSGTVSGSGSYVVGSNATLNATPSTGYAFSSWSGNCAGTANPYLITNIQTNFSCTANFVLRTYTLTTNVSPSGVGIVSGVSNPYTHGTTAYISATATNNRYVFSSWTGACSGTNTLVTVLMDSAKNCTANFVLLPVSVMNSTFTSGSPIVSIPGSTTLTLTVKDSGGNNVSGHNIAFTTNEGIAVLTPTSSTTNASGVSTTTISSAIAHKTTVIATDTTESPNVSWQIGVTFTGGSIYYVSTSGNDNNNGSQSTPWRTIQKAANSVNAGDTVLIGEGIYNERVTISRSGSADNLIKFTKLGNNRPQISRGIVIAGNYIEFSEFKPWPMYSGIGSETAAVQIMGNNNYIHHFEIPTGSLGGSAIVINEQGASTYNIVSNFEVTDINGVCGAYGPQTSRNVIKDGYCHGFGDNVAIGNLDGSYNTLENVEITGVGISHTTSGWSAGANADADGIHPLGDNNVIRGVKIHHLWPTPLASDAHTDSIQFWNHCRNLLVENSVFGSYASAPNDSALPGAADPPNAVLMMAGMESGSSITFRNNIVLGTGSGAGFWLMFNENGPYEVNINIYNNTLWSNSNLMSKPRMTGNFKNNIARSNYSGQILDTMTFSNNLFSSSGYQRGSNYIIGNPQFVNGDVSSTTNYGVNADFHLQGNSPAINAGIQDANTPATDADGHTRFGLPEIGAYEYQGSGPSCTLGNGDVNKDGRVNISDAAILMAKWGQTVTNEPADINCDGRVNISDAAILMAKWGTQV